MAPKVALHNRSQRGFSLIQIGILLTIASLVMVTVLPSTKLKLNNDSGTSVRLNALMKSLREYQLAHSGMLPCPANSGYLPTDANYGMATATGGTCTGSAPAADEVDSTHKTAAGMVPVRTLGLSNDWALDGYGRNIDYLVDTAATTCWASPLATGNLTIADNGGVYNSVVALVSHGRNGSGAFLIPSTSGTAVQFSSGSTDSDEAINEHTPPTSVSAASTGTLYTGTSSTPGGSSVTLVKKAPTSTFDDLVVYNYPDFNMNAIPANASPPFVANVVPPPNNAGYSSTATAPLNVFDFTVYFNKPVNVTAAVSLQLAAVYSSSTTNQLNGQVATPTNSNVTPAACYINNTYTGTQTGNGVTALYCQYTIQSSDQATSGIVITGFTPTTLGTFVDTATGASFSPCVSETLPNVQIAAVLDCPTVTPAFVDGNTYRDNLNAFPPYPTYSTPANTPPGVLGITSVPNGYDSNSFAIYLTATWHNAVYVTPLQSNFTTYTNPSGTVIANSSSNGTFIPATTSLINATIGSGGTATGMPFYYLSGSSSSSLVFMAPLTSGNPSPLTGLTLASSITVGASSTLKTGGGTNACTTIQSPIPTFNSIIFYSTHP